MHKRFTNILFTVITLFLFTEKFNVNIIAQNETVNSLKQSADSVRAVSIVTSFNSRNRHNKITLLTNEKDAVIHYTLNGSEPTSDSPVFTKAIQLFGSGKVKAAAFKNGKLYGKVDSLILVNHKAIGVIPEYKTKYNPKYNGGGRFGLTDGIRGGKHFKDGLWQGVEGDDFEIIIDLQFLKSVSKITFGTLQNADSSIFFPAKVTLYGSQDGMEYHKIDEIVNRVPLNTNETKLQDFVFSKKFNARFIKISAENIGVCPAWHPNAGGKAWIFADEAVVK